ncbi:MAG: methionyl-tRNA formyltransferase [Anaerolineaceae bacterium]|nr:methionyl-tRNA formyltransferase [Anaerolineaceae bacterium]
MSEKVVFMGSPDLAAKILESLVTKYRVVGVVTQPDRPAGRGKILTSPPVKVLADQLGIATIQPERLKDEAFAQLQAWNPDVIVVAAFGQILRQRVLDLPKFGCINVHASYLPRWRGAAPIQAAILHGDEFTGVSIMKMDAGIDTGPVLIQEKVYLAEDETLSSLTDKLSILGGSLLIDALEDYIAGRLSPTPQPESGDTYAGMLSKEDGLLDFSKSAIAIDRKVRALNDWPGTFCDINGQVLKVRKVKIQNSETQPAGMRSVLDKVPAISTPDGWVLLLEVQPAGKKWMPGTDFLRGFQNWKTD